jgi:hypothetical protein
MLQPMKDEPPTATKCKDKFLIQSLTITPDKEQLQLADMWIANSGEEPKVHQHKIRVVYLPAEGQIAEEDEEPLANQSSMGNDSRYDTVRQHPGTTDTSADHMPDFTAQDKELHHDEPEHHAEFSESHEEQTLPHVNGNTNGTNGIVITPPSPPPATAAEDRHITELVSAPAPAASGNYEAPPSITELETQLYLAQSEIERLRFMLSTSGEPDASIEEDADTAPMNLRRRTRQLSDATSTAAPTEFGTGTVLEDHQLQLPDGVPLNVVLGIALGVFLVTYLFF